ncbi:MAG: uracil-DNA glycosylase [Actinomycetota bacterium]
MSWTTLEEVRTEALACTRCRLASGRTQVVWMDGNPRSDLMFVGEAPGFHEDRQGLPFVGAAGQLLDAMLRQVDLSRADCCICNVIKCRPPGNRDPMPDELEACRPYLDAQISMIRPRVIATLGNFATRFVLGRQVSISRVRGQRFRAFGAEVIPTFHPAAVLRGGGMASTTIKAFEGDFRLIRQVLEDAREREAAATAVPVPDAVPVLLREQQALF